MALRIFVAALAVLGEFASAAAQERLPIPDSTGSEKTSSRPLLTPDQWKRVDSAVDRGLRFIANSQEADGSFPTQGEAQPGVTSLCILSFLARGHQPGKGPYGSRIDRAVDYVLNMQDPGTGGIMPANALATQNMAAHYSHGISGLMLAEVYGMADARRHERIRAAIIAALSYTRQAQIRPKGDPAERGGWRYIHRRPVDSDLSVTSWQLMFLRAARNADFDVPREWVREAMDYVHRSFDENQRAFVYALSQKRFATRGMVGAGIVCLELGGEHRSETARIAGDWILSHSFTQYNRTEFSEDRYHYGAFYCSQAMFQLGGHYWERFFPPLLTALTDAQHPDGSWDPESGETDSEYGNVYTTCMAILALAPPYQILPIYQR